MFAAVLSEAGGQRNPHRGVSFRGHHNQFLEGRRFSRIRSGNVPCIERRLICGSSATRVVMYLTPIDPNWMNHKLHRTITND